MIVHKYNQVSGTPAYRAAQALLQSVQRREVPPRKASNRLMGLHALGQNGFELRDQRFYDAVDDALMKSLPAEKHRHAKRFRTRAYFSHENLGALEKFTGLNLAKYTPKHIRVKSSLEPGLSYTNLKVMLFSAARDHEGPLNFYHNYIKYTNADKEAKQRVVELKKELSAEEISAAHMLMRNSIKPSKMRLNKDSLDRMALRSGIPANYFLTPALHLKDGQGNPLERFYSKDEAYASLLEATALAERPAPYVYYHANARKQAQQPFSKMSSHEHRLDHYGVNERNPCERGRYIWTQKVFDVCKIIGVDLKTLEWNKFMDIVHKVNEICVRNLDRTQRITRRARHVLTKDELYELCRDVGISRQHLLKQEAVEQQQRRITVGGCMPPLT